MAIPKPRVGDRVSVTFEGVVFASTSTHLSIRAEGGDNSTTFDSDEFTNPSFKLTITEWKLKPKDSVILRENDQPATVVACDDSLYWVKFPDGTRGEYTIDQLERV